MVVKDRKHIDPAVWTEAHARLLKRAASYPEVARIFVHPPIKAELCKWATGDRSWLAKVRPYFGHNYHFHIRINCPEDSPTARTSRRRPRGWNGLRRRTCLLAGRQALAQAAPSPRQTAEPVKPAPPLTLAALPAECRAVVTAE